jgi:polypeptide N-acetylgalactosaminyltransferase
MKSHLVAEKRNNAVAEEDDNVIAPPQNPAGPGEMGRPVRIENPDPETKRKLDEGWQKNAFNQYVSDMISVHRSLPDHRSDMHLTINMFMSSFP